VITIAVDAMGGDYAPKATVKGALDALEDPQGSFHIALIGDEKRIEAELAGTTDRSRLSVIHTTQTIEMDESATTMIKSKKDSSIVKGLELQREGELQAFISAGNTGAVMAASTLILGRTPGVQRPTIGTFFPSQQGMTLLIDAGANVDCKPMHLFQFGIMGSIFTELIRDIPHPTVGLISVGEEESKGDDATKEAHKLFKDSSLNFVGNIEGRDILTGSVDVAVCDGFVGNTILKFAESVPRTLKFKLREYASRGIFQKLWIGLFAGTLRGILKEWDYQQYGGVPLLGVNGVSIIGHGSSSPLAIKNMILRANEMAERKVNDRIAASLENLAPGSSRPEA
jgi:phosphate acyltransferase